MAFALCLLHCCSFNSRAKPRFDITIFCNMVLPSLASRTSWVERVSDRPPPEPLLPCRRRPPFWTTSSERSRAMKISSRPSTTRSEPSAEKSTKMVTGFGRWSEPSFRSSSGSCPIARRLSTCLPPCCKLKHDQTSLTRFFFQRFDDKSCYSTKPL